MTPGCRRGPLVTLTKPLGKMGKCVWEGISCQFGLNKIPKMEVGMTPLLHLATRGRPRFFTELEIVNQIVFMWFDFDFCSPFKSNVGIYMATVQFRLDFLKVVLEGSWHWWKMKPTLACRFKQEGNRNSLPDKWQDWRGGMDVWAGGRFHLTFK